MTTILDLFFPPRCAFCGKLLDAAGDICEECEKILPLREPGAVLRAVGTARYPCAVAMYYARPVSDGIKAMKFGKKSWRAKPFARYVARAARDTLYGRFNGVTYVPVSWQRNFSRGFDQARLLADETARLWGTRAEPTLWKIRNNRSQSAILSPAARLENVRDVYIVPHPRRVRGRKFLLIDDVCTTGSTLSAAADALMAAGASDVVCAALAGGHRKRYTAQK